MSYAESDRELLELAAKAIGYATTSSWNADRMKMAPPVIALVVHKDGELVSTGWDPLNEDGPALRLAVTLRMVIHHAKKYVVVMDAEKETAHHEDVRDNGGDAFAATRRAIVRAAAEIGRTM